MTMTATQPEPVRAARRRLFSDREDAGRLLARRVAVHLSTMGIQTRPLVIALPRGGVPAAVAVARMVDADLGAMVVRRIRAPGRSQICVGAVTALGPPVFDLPVLHRLGLGEAALVTTVARARARAEQEMLPYSRSPGIRITDRLVVVVDDGLTTGITACAALRQLRTYLPSRLVMAAPICSPAARTMSGSYADTVIALHIGTTALRLSYGDFHQLTATDVERAFANRYPASVR